MDSSVVSTDLSQPKDLIELELILIWQRILRNGSIRRKDDFFELGGQSLLATILVVEINKCFNLKLASDILFHFPTIDTLASHLRKEYTFPKSMELVPLQPLGTKPPLFLIHGWGGRVYGFRLLARSLGLDRPVYGIEATGLDGSGSRHIAVEAMAGYYTDQIQSLKYDGPCFIGGYSLGGLIAFEVARQLSLRGEKVACVFLLDCSSIGVIPWTNPSYVWQRFQYHCQRLQKMKLNGGFEYFKEIFGIVKTRVLFFRNKREIAKASTDEQLAELAIYKDYYEVVTKAHRAQRYSGKVAVFFSQDLLLRDIADWKHLVKGVLSYHPLMGNHFTFLTQKHVDNLAKNLNCLMDEV
jgi:thioesterase domain-containing protein